MKLYELLEKLKNAELKKVASVAITGIAGVWILRTTLSIILMGTTAHFIYSLFTAMGNEQQEMSDRFRRDFDRDSKQISDEMREFSENLQKESDEDMKKVDKVLAESRAFKFKGE